VRLEVQVLHVKAVGREAQPGLGGTPHTLVGDGSGTGELAALQLRPREVVRGPQLDAEDPGLAGLGMRGREQLDRFLVATIALAQQAE
jgi:hypothetical protein